jgi:hypothetical protein
MSAAIALLRRVPAVVWIIAALVAAIVVQSWRLGAARAEAKLAGLEALNAKARADSLRRVVGLSARDSSALKLGDSVQVLTQLVVQGKQQRDAIDRALKQEQTANVQLRATIAELRTSTSGTGVVVGPNDTRSDTFNVRQTPYTISARATLPAAGAGRLDVGVRLDPANVGVRLGCSVDRFVGGVRQANVTLTAPTWLELATSSVTQDAGVCETTGQAATTKPRAWWKPAIAVGYGATFSRDSTRALKVTHGPSVLAGWIVW